MSENNSNTKPIPALSKPLLAEVFIQKHVGKLIKENRIRRKFSLNKLSNELYGSRYYVNYLSKIEKGEIEGISLEMIYRILFFLEYDLTEKLK